MSPNQDLPKIKTPLQRQMTLTLSGIIVGMVLLVGLPIVFISVRIQQQVSIQEQQEMADETAQTIGEILQGLQTNQLQTSLTNMADSDAEFVANEITTILNLTISRVSAQVQDAVRKEIPLVTLFTTNPQIQGLLRFTADGDLQQSLWPDGSPASPTIRPSEESLQLTQQGLNTQEAVFFNQDYIPIMVIATPLMTEDDQPDGLTLTWVSLPGLWPFLTDLPVGETGYLYIINQNGDFVSLPSRFSDQAASPVIPPSSQLNTPYRGLGGERVIGIVAPIENTAWRVVIEIPLTEARSSLRSLLIILVAILLFGISLAISVARLFSRWLLQPIHTLHLSATRISAGDLAHRIDLHRSDELGFLAGAFNQMVATLEQTINELRNVSLNILSTQERERHRIAQEIHDELGQTLTALRLHLWMGLQTDPENQTLLAAHQQATSAQEKARTLSHELRPAMLDDLGLLPTLEWYTDRVEQRANLAIVLEAQVDETTLPSSIKTALYRLIAEALTNITKHAQASVVEICLREDDYSLRLVISDDGVGFDTAILAETQSLGVRGMRERVNLLRGQFLIESVVGQGTRLTITLPLSREELKGIVNSE